MTAASTLRTLTRQHEALVFLLDGVPYGWTTHEDLAGTGWIGDRTLLQGLKFPKSLKMGINIMRGTLTGNPSTIELDDFSDNLVSIFRTKDPSQTPLTFNLSAGATAGASLYSKFVGTEAIGSAGERHRYTCINGWEIGQEHIANHPNLLPPMVSDNPVMWRGRKCSIYRVHRDVADNPGPDDQSVQAHWRPWSESDLIWWGTLTGSMRVRGKVWALSVDGPDSWLKKPLGTLYARDPLPVRSIINLNNAPQEDETKIAISFRRVDDTNWSGVQVYGESEFGHTFTGTDVSTLRGELQTAIDTVKAQSGTDGVFESVPEKRDAHFDSSTGEFWVKIQNTAPSKIAVMMVAMHAKAWQTFGFDMIAQKKLEGFESGNETDVHWVNFGSFDDNGGQLSLLGSQGADIWTAPGSGYWMATMTTISRNASGTPYDNDGQPRIFLPAYKGGTVTLESNLSAGQGQAVRLGLGLVYQPGSLARPPASDPEDDTIAYSLPVGDVNASGLWLFWGKRKFEIDGDEFDEFQVGMCSWRTGTLGQEHYILGDNGAEIVIHKWLNPRHFGFDRPPLSSDWNQLANNAKKRINAVPLVHLGYQGPGWMDEADIVLARLLYSTGTSTGWTGFEGGTASLDPGDNEPLFAIVARDGEIADLGLGIPSSLITDVFTWQIEGQSLPDPDLKKVKLVYTAPVDSLEVIRGIMSAYGWCWNLKGGKYGFFTPFEAFDPNDADASKHLTTAKLAADAEATELDFIEVEVMDEPPIDRFKLSYDWNPLDRKSTEELEFQSSDRDVRYRSSDVEHHAVGHGMRKTPLNWRARMAELSEFLSRGKVQVTVEVLSTTAQDLWPGDRVLISDDYVVNESGTYGVTKAPGLVLSREEHPAATDDQPRYILELLVETKSATQIRARAPSAMSGRGYDSANGRLYIKDNHLQIPAENWADANLFLKPWWLDDTGDMDIKGKRRRSSGTWDTDWTATVTGINTDTTGNHYLTITNFSGKYRRDSEYLIVPREEANQSASWVKNLFAPICDENGNYDPGSGLTTGHQWQG